ncbi:MAG: hypothetical protein II721_03860 [Bacilli bacterium]|nr:hypothetical protein [Bacilli bacterium]
MKRARHYIEYIRKSYGRWLLWLEEDETYIRQSRLHFLNWIKTITGDLRKLDAQDVKDAILEHEDSIGLRLKRLDDYKLLPTLEEIFKTKGITAQLPDAEINAAIDGCRQLIEVKALDLIRVVRECESYIKPQNPIIKKALENPLLLSYFYDNKKVLEEYINYCLSDTNIKLKAMRAMELADEGKIKKDYVRKPLHKALERIGLNVGTYPHWNESVNLV